MRRLFSITILATILATIALAADVTGKWKSEFETPDGQTRTSTYTFKVDGDKLTGTVSSPRGDAEISEGKVSGDTISFTLVRNFNGNEVKILYKGKVSGDEIKFTVTFGEADRVMDQTAKRIP